MYSVGIVCGFLPGALLGAQTPMASPQQQPAERHAQHPATVTFSDGLLTVNAANSSLNNIIREIARQTGMKVTGSVAEDRVFGSYGPADPQKVIAALLDGTGTNILIVSSRQDVPVTLVLTPRTGSATPPNPNAPRDSDDEDAQAPPPATVPFPNAQHPRGPSFPGAIPRSQGAAQPNPAATQPSSTDQTVVFPPVDTTTPPATATAAPADTDTPSDNPADSVKTPQQIFEQLQRMRQQQQAPPASTENPQ